MDESVARLQAWVVQLLTLAVEARDSDFGRVIGCGAGVVMGEHLLRPHVAFVASETGRVALAVSIFTRSDDIVTRAHVRDCFVQAGVLEHWQLDAESGEAVFYQLNARGDRYDCIPPDVEGMHYSVAIESLSFPTTWLRQQPSLLEMMQAWNLIEISS